MDGDFILSCGGYVARQTSYALYEETQYWKRRALLAENSDAPEPKDEPNSEGGGA